MRHYRDFFLRNIKADKGAAMTEYALIIAILVVPLMSVKSSIGVPLQNTFIMAQCDLRYPELRGRIADGSMGMAISGGSCGTTPGGVGDPDGGGGGPMDSMFATCTCLISNQMGMGAPGEEPEDPVET